MGHLLGIRIQRYKALYDVTLGKFEHDKTKEDLPPLTCLLSDLSNFQGIVSRGIR